ncbi:MAG: sugar ABC transporter substrate-binding protein [Actinobacteria bacterium]|nr:sugar ABC transporter substrate-binding protein [Actinomycetota bacterium]
MRGIIPKISLILIIVLVVFFSFVGCKTATTETTAAETTAAATTAAETTAAATTAAETTAAGPTLSKIGYSMLSSYFEYFQRVILGMQNESKANNIELLLDDPQLDLDAQVTGLSNLLTAGSQVLVITSLDPVAVEAAVNEAHAKNVPVISHVSSFKGADVYIGLPEYQFGLTGGDAFGAKLVEMGVLEGKTVKIAVLAADVLGEGLVQRVQGVIDGFTKHFPDAEIVARADAFDEDTALQTLETMLQANPDINVVLTSNDPGDYGAIAAIEAAGKVVNEDVYVCGLGDQFRTLDLVEQGKLLTSLSVSPEATGVQMVEVAIKLYNGEKVDKNIYIGSTVLTKDNVAAFRDYKLSFGPIKE